MKEDILRDFLAENLHLLEDGLELLKKERFLPNEFGSNGFLDILAKDRSGNFVVIEVKIAKYAEREAFTELLKYMGLMKRHLGSRESEIRLFIVSPDWRELTVPFSEFASAVSYNVTGYKVTISGESVTAVSIQPPLPPAIGRSIVPRHWAQFYNEEKERDNKSEIYAEKIKQRGIKNFVIVRFEVNYGYTAGYCFYFAQQRETREFHEKVLRDASTARYEEIMEYVEDFDDDDALNEIADASTDMINVSADELEIGHPEKFKGWYERGNWIIEKISRFGTFSRDERLTDEMIINELCGHTGQSYTWYNAAARSGDKSKRSEIRSSYANCLHHNDQWRRDLRDILEWEETHRSGALALSIFNPENIIESIYLYDRTGNPSYIPKFTVVSDDRDDDRLHVFRGLVIATNKSPATWAEIVERHFDGDMSNYHFATHLHGIYEMNNEIMGDLGLRYVTMHQVFDSDETTEGFEPVIRGSSVRTKDKLRGVPFEAWLREHSELVKAIASSFDAHVHYSEEMEP
ncbi:endonuclease NucS domain-containing protein [Sinorhizobium medicae]|uniref:endonuclease NucS domain-containing protein n=1 Tax=Sinorhizobium medicae TaxID=110321 RepID=UPI000414CF11|nr:endonuclease NucS domain-containing protein [Sinorhizobium medicae]